MDEQRRAPRYPVDFTVTCRWKGGQQESLALNLSRGGLLIASPEDLTTGMLMEVSFALPPAETISLKAIVRHASEERNSGVEFVEILPSHQARLAQYLKRLDAAVRAASTG